MAVRWKAHNTHIPVADHRDFSSWLETNRYQEIVNGNNNKHKITKIKKEEEISDLNKEME